MALEKDGQFPITCFGCYTTSELIQGRYDWANKLFTDDRFPLKRHRLCQRLIEPVEFNRHPSTQDVFEKLVDKKLQRPTYEDAFYFGVQHRDAYLTRPWVFLHEPVEAPSGFPRYTVIYSFDGVRVIDLYVDDGWIKFCFFAGIRVEN